VVLIARRAINKHYRKITFFSRIIANFVLAFALIFPQIRSSEDKISTGGTDSKGAFCNYGAWKTPRFFPSLSADVGACIKIRQQELDFECYRDSYILQQNALNYTLWASLSKFECHTTKIIGTQNLTRENSDKIAIFFRMILRK